MELTFNIIFMPGSVRYLRLGVLSLLEFSPYRYRLVSNGLSGGELSALEEFSKAHARLEFHRYPAGRMAHHGTVLKYLEECNGNEYFCFMDSDIFATGPFHEELERHVTNCDITSSCMYIGAEKDAPGKGHDGGTPGAHNNGLPLSTTFFCVYRSAPLRKVIEETGVSFERYRPGDAIPDGARRRCGNWASKSKTG